MFRILSLAGGGLRGAFGIGVLHEIESRLDRPLWEYFDLIAGTSTGSITATALCVGMSMAELREFYIRHSEQIFHPREPYRPPGYLRPVWPMIRSLFKRRGQNPDHFFQSRYCPFSLTDAMEEGFRDARLRDATKSRLIVPVVNLTDGVAEILRTPHLPDPSVSCDWRLADVIIASAAAPTYFPHKQMPNGKNYADGGLWAIDPGVAALAEAMTILGDCCWTDETRFNLGEISLLSIGTGQAMYSLSPPGGDAGMLFWGRHIANVMGVSQIQGARLPLRVALQDRYQQIDFPLEDPRWTLDNTQITEQLYELGLNKGTECFPSLRERFFAEPTEPYTPPVAGNLG